MATLKEQITQAESDIKRFTALLASANDYAKANKLKGKTDAQKQYAKALDDARKKLIELKGKSAEKEKTPKQKQDDAAQAAKESLPTAVDDKLWNEIRNIIPNASPEVFKLGGAGAGILVYQGQKKGTTTSPTGGTYTTKIDNIALTNEVTNSFWQDTIVQKKILNTLIAAGQKNATQLDAFALWQSAVNKAAELYAAGKGPKFTPMDIVDMMAQKLRTPGAKTGPDITTYIDMPKDSELMEKLKARIMPIIMKEPKEAEAVFQNIINDVKALYAKGTTTTTTTDAKTGKKTVKQTGGVSNEMIDSIIKKYYNEGNQDFLEAKSLEAVDYITSWMRS